MKDEGYVILDTRVIDKVIAQRESLMNSYKEINDEYDRIVRDLARNWKGRGADAFQKDAKAVKRNITGIAAPFFQSVIPVLEIITGAKILANKIYSRTVDARLYGGAKP